MKTSIINIHHKLPYDVYIGRPGRGQMGYFGNPVIKGKECDFCSEVHELAGDTLDCFRAYFEFRIENDPTFKENVLALKGKILGCFCKPGPCHGDVYVDYLESC